MASSLTKTNSGNVTSYIVTDAQGSTATVVLTESPGSGKTLTLSSVGGLHPDGMQRLSTLMQLVSTGLTP